MFMTSDYRFGAAAQKEYRSIKDSEFFNGATLPVLWIDFKGRSENNQVELRWSIEEMNNQRFEIERSVNGTDFVRIATVSSKGNGRNNYCFDCVCFITGRNYYRVKQVDGYGITSYSKVITVNVEKRSLVTIGDPIVTSELRVTVNNDNEGTLMIADGSGKNLYKGTAVNGTNFISTNAFSKGVYHLIYFHGEEDVETYRFMKQ
jgi:hypothetical protein